MAIKIYEVSDAKKLVLTTSNQSTAEAKIKEITDEGAGVEVVVEE
tara:strand:- start:113 stop:247 length:135 start_codon:yes stop_codon:yes gene_type:complete